MKTINLLTGAAMSAALLLMMSACGGKSKDAKADTGKQKEETPMVTLDTARSENVEQITELTATVKANAKNDIASQSPGRIQKIYTEVGHYVSKGQLLVKMDPTSLLQTKTQLANCEADYKRTLALSKAGGASQQAVDQLKVQLDVTRETYNNLLTNVNLKAPISGVVTARNYDSGDLYKGGDPIVTINDIQPVKIVVNVSEENFAQVKMGMNVKVKVDVYSDETFNGKVSLIYPTMDATTRTFPVEITIANGNRKVRPGMFARATLNLGSAKHVLVPDVAIQKQMGSGDHFVYIYKDGTVSYSKVELGRLVGDRYEIISGVPDGAYVVTSGASKLTDGMAVKVVGDK